MKRKSGKAGGMIFAAVAVSVSMLTSCGLGGIAAGGGGGGGGGGDLPPVNWRMVSTWGEGNTHLEADRRFIELVYELSGGRFNITLFPAGQLGADHQVLSMVQMGMVEAGGDWPGYWSGIDSGFDLLGTTMHNFTGMDYFAWIWEAGGLDMYHFMYHQHGVHYYPILIHWSESGLRGNIPVHGIADLQGQRIRLAGRIQGIVAERIGFTPIMISALELYEAMMLGVVDMGEFSVPTADYSLMLHEAARYWSVPAWHQSAGVNGVMFNMAAWNALTDDHRRIARHAAMMTSAEFLARYLWSDAQTTRRMLQDGVTVTFFNPDDLAIIAGYVREAEQQLADDNPNYARVLGSIRNFRYYIDPYRDMLGPFSWGHSFPEFGFENRWMNNPNQ